MKPLLIQHQYILQWKLEMNKLKPLVAAGLVVNALLVCDAIIGSTFAVVKNNWRLFMAPIGINFSMLLHPKIESSGIVKLYLRTPAV